jgi:hypothetical protein
VKKRVCRKCKKETVYSNTGNYNRAIAKGSLCLPCSIGQRKGKPNGKIPANTKEMSGKRFGMLVVKEKSHTAKKELFWLCICDCGEETKVRGTSLRSGNSRSCGCLKKVPYNWKGVEEISSTYWYNQKIHAQTRSREFSITPEYAWGLFVEQERKCRYTGMELSFTRNYRNDKVSQTASLDRIDSSKGYVEGNIQWVHKDVNRMKSNLTHDKFIKLCKLIAMET